MITVKIENQAGFRRIQHTIGRNIPTAHKKAATDIAEMITNEIKALAPVWRGGIVRGTRWELITKNQIGIKMPSYAAYVEKGHRLTAVTPTLRLWAYTKPLPYPKGWLDIVEKFGTVTEAHPFIEPAIARVRPKMHTVLKENIFRGVRR